MLYTLREKDEERPAARPEAGARGRQPAKKSIVSGGSGVLQQYSLPTIWEQPA